MKLNNLSKEAERLVKDISKGKIPPDPPRVAPRMNKEIDKRFHKAAKENPSLWIVDSILHMGVEVGDQVAQSATKSLRYNGREVINQMRKKK